MLQIKRRKDDSSGIRLMATICLYQDTRHEKALLWIKKVLNKGYCSRRSDGMTELRINGFDSVRETLEDLKPYIRFKSKQASTMITACNLLLEISVSKMNSTQKKKVLKYILAIRNQNYLSKKAKSESELKRLLGLTP